MWRYLDKIAIWKRRVGQWAGAEKSIVWCMHTRGQCHTTAIHTLQFWNLVTRPKTTQCWYESKLVSPGTCLKHWSVSQFISDISLYIADNRFLRGKMSWVNIMVDHCNGPTNKQSMPYNWRTFIFMGTGYSLWILAVNHYIRVLYCRKDMVYWCATVWRQRIREEISLV